MLGSRSEMGCLPEDFFSDGEHVPRCSAVRCLRFGLLEGEGLLRRFDEIMCLERSSPKILPFGLAVFFGSGPDKPVGP